MFWITSVCYVGVYIELLDNACIFLTSFATLPEKCPNTEFFLVCIFLYSVQIQENTDQKKLRIWTLFTQWV